MRKKIKAFLIPIITVVLIAAALVFCFNYFFHRTFKIDSEFDTSDVTWYSGKDAIYHSVASNKFSHMASYGAFIYEFTIDADGTGVPVGISVFKTNSKKHDNVKIIIERSENKSELLIRVYQNGNERFNSAFDIVDNKNIQINIGP